MKTFLKWAGNVFLVLAVLLTIYLIYLQIQIRKDPMQALNLLKYKPITVMTGSMRPYLEPGDLIIVKSTNPQKVKEGDVITFIIDQKTLVTHRVTQIMNDDGLMFKTKGDKNDSEDKQLISSNQLIGVCAFKISHGGYVANFIRSKAGFVTVVCIPFVLLILAEVIHIYKESKAKN